MSEPFSLTGRFVHLLPMEIGHIDALVEVATDDRSTFGFTPVPRDRDDMTDYVHRALAKRAAGEHCPFVTFSPDQQRIVGSTRFYDLDTWDWSSVTAEAEARPGPDVASIGYTWLHPSVQRTPVNTEAKLLMLTHAFEQWGVRAVRFWTDARNARSRAAIQRLGCTLDGVVRADRPAADGTVRDSATYSMLASEWPASKPRLAERLTG